MKQVFLLIVFGLFSLNSFGQYQWLFSPGVNLNMGYLLNKSDKQSGAVKTTAAPRPALNVQLGHLDHSRSWFQGWSTGADIVYYAGRTSMSGANGSEVYTSNTHSNLAYLRVPFLLHFGISEQGKWQPFFNVGIYGAWLFYYKESIQIDYQQPNYYSKYEVTTIGKKIHFKATSTNTGASGDDFYVTMKNYLYRPFDWGVQGALGTSYRVNDRIKVSVGIQVSYGCITDIERKGKIEDLGSAISTIPRQLFFDGSYWDHNTPKGQLSIYKPSLRSATHLLVPSLQISVSYPLKNR